MINERLDSIEDLMYHLDELNNFRSNLKALPDLEKSLSSVYQYSIAQNKKAVYFENISLKRLSSFYELICTLKGLPQLLEPLGSIKSTFMSKRLKQLVTFNKLTQQLEEMQSQSEKPDEQSDCGPQTEDTACFENLDIDNGLFPDISEEIKEFEAMIEWKTEGEKQIPQPTQGLDSEFDHAIQAVEAVKEKLYDYLVTVQLRFEDTSIKYSHAKYRYELEIPEKLVKGSNKPDDYEFTSSRKGYQRFHTP